MFWSQVDFLLRYMYVYSYTVYERSSLTISIVWCMGFDFELMMMEDKIFIIYMRNDVFKTFIFRGYVRSNFLKSILCNTV
jgi:hypothetical protein